MSKQTDTHSASRANPSRTRLKSGSCSASGVETFFSSVRWSTRNGGRCTTRAPALVFCGPRQSVPPTSCRAPSFASMLRRPPARSTPGPPQAGEFALPHPGTSGPGDQHTVHEPRTGGDEPHLIRSRDRPLRLFAGVGYADARRTSPTSPPRHHARQSTARPSPRHRFGPAAIDERAGPPSSGGEVGGGEFVSAEPVEECLGCASVSADAKGLLPGGRAPVVAGAQTPEQVPDQVAVSGWSAGCPLPRSRPWLAWLRRRTPCHAEMRLFGRSGEAGD